MQNKNNTWPVSVWVGVADGDFDEYINQDKYWDSCGFCLDIGQIYDVDKTSIYVSKTLNSVKELSDEILFSECFENELFARCHSLGLIDVNACISILDETFDFSSDKDFCGLRFIGVFDYSLPDNMLNWNKSEDDSASNL
ncbi:immunity 22 family protein [Salmonella enterica]|uniref:immunity 22 family protein n=1 Tax=Salmonella enterica TaxID=28901 RepID=UPI003AAF4647